MDKDTQIKKESESAKDKGSSLPMFSIAIIAFILSIINFIDIKTIKNDMNDIRTKIESVSGVAASIINDETAPIIDEIREVLDKYN